MARKAKASGTFRHGCENGKATEVQQREVKPGPTMSCLDGRGPNFHGKS